jgi:NAD(P)-dependent dehydrogenase (short-subunit alcohol dehydrogenase family)
MSNEVHFDKSCLDTLRGKVVVFTGGASGIGKEAVTMFAQAGAQIVFGDIDKVNGSKLESELGRCV